MAANHRSLGVSVQKPTSNTPVLQRRNKLTANIEQQITKIGSFREGKRISREQFWVDAAQSISNCDMASSRSNWRKQEHAQGLNVR